VIAGSGCAVGDERAQLHAIQPQRRGLDVDFGAPHVFGRGPVQDLVDDREPVEPRQC
jgi:hypothetical protein